MKPNLALQLQALTKYLVAVVCKDMDKQQGAYSIFQSTNMIFITQLLYVKEGQAEVFEQFEALAIPIIGKYNGKLLLRIRPQPDSIIETNTEIPYEIHLVSFASGRDFEDFKQDEERKQFLHLKEQSIRSAILIQGTQL